MENEVIYPVNSGENQEVRDEKGRYKPGFSGNPLGQGAGRPKTGLKEYDRERFSKMTPEEKEVFLKTVSPELRYKMAEGNPHQDTDVTSQGEKILGVVVLPSKEEQI